MLTHVGDQPAARYLDIRLWRRRRGRLAPLRLATDGSVVGIDLDQTKIGLAREEAAATALRNVEYGIHPVMEQSLDGDRFNMASMPGSS